MFGRRGLSQADGIGDDDARPSIPLRGPQSSVDPQPDQQTISGPVSPAPKPSSPDRRIDLNGIYAKLQASLFDRIDAAAASRIARDDLFRQIHELLSELINEHRYAVTQKEQAQIANRIVDDMVGLGPIETLLRDDSITDIMVNGPSQVYVERGGRLQLTDVLFRDNQHVMNVAQKIVTRVGRRVDETCPIADARLPDGSRVNIIASPLSIDGCTISIRKFSRRRITLDMMARQGNLSDAIAKVLKIAAACRLNIVISGGTGSGKTTLLNALSQLIDPGERIVTIEDAAELQLQQPHVVRLETRPPNIEGHGEITIRDLVRNSLRMRPDRIICGEVRGGEALDMLQAMNTGHDGSMCTLHANNPREAVTRLENMVGMAATLPTRAIRTQIVGAVNLIIQIARMRDGVRRITHVTEIVGLEGDVVTMHDLFSFEYEGEARDGTLLGSFKPSAVRPHFSKRAAHFGLDRALQAAIG